MTATTRPVSPKENLYGAELQSVCHSDAQDEQRKNCVDREEISEGERMDDRELSRCQAIRNIRSSMVVCPPGQVFFSKKTGVQAWALSMFCRFLWIRMILSSPQVLYIVIPHGVAWNVVYIRCFIRYGS